MNELIQVAVEVQNILDSKGYRNCVIGGLAVQVWGEVRVTTDVDFTVLVEFGQEESVVEGILEVLKPRYEDAKRFALINRVLLCQGPNDYRVDIGLGGFEVERRIVGRAKFHELIEGISLRVCDAEGLVVMKAFSGRAIDWQDVESILARQWETIDLGLIKSDLGALAEGLEAPEILENFEKVVLWVNEAQES